jgi:hypothetical protein
MNPVRILGFTRELAKGQPEYLNLCIRDEAALIMGQAGVPVECNAMVSAWEPTPQQLAMLNAGGRVHLRILGVQHPPVSLWVEEAK